jgi:hypothetical protein
MRRSASRLLAGRARFGAAAAIVIITVLAGCGTSGPDLPAGAFGKLISCLQAHPSLSVQASTGRISPRTNSIEVWGNFHGGELAAMNAVGTSYVAPVGTDGMTVGERLAIEGCLAHSRPAARQLPSTSTTSSPAPELVVGGYAGSAREVAIGPTTDIGTCPGNSLPYGTLGEHTSCGFAAAVYRIFERAHQATGWYPALLEAHSQATDANYLVRCIVRELMPPQPPTPYEADCGTNTGAEVVIELAPPQQTATTPAATEAQTTTSTATTSTTAAKFFAGMTQCNASTQENFFYATPASPGCGFARDVVASKAFAMLASSATGYAALTVTYAGQRYTLRCLTGGRSGERIECSHGNPAYDAWNGPNVWIVYDEDSAYTP